MKIEVRQEHIEKGKPAFAQYCALALAFEEALGLPPESVAVCNGRVQIPGCSSNYELPTQADIFYHDFDNYREVKPFTFEMDIPPLEETGG